MNKFILLLIVCVLSLSKSYALTNKDVLRSCINVVHEQQVERNIIENAYLDLLEKKENESNKKVRVRK